MNENLNTPAIKKGSELELEIESLAYGGMGLARKENFVIFVKGAIPGQKVLAKIYRKKSGFAEARVLTLLTESSNAVEVKCNHYYICSKVQSLSYDEQLKEKSNQVEDAFRRLGGFSNFELSGKVGAEKIFNYRNKMEFTFSPHRWVLDSEPEGVNKSFALNPYTLPINNLLNCPVAKSSARSNKFSFMLSKLAASLTAFLISSNFF